jgi:type III restriction enzyme
MQAGNLRTFSTAERPADSVSAAELRRASKTIFVTNTSVDGIDEEQREFFSEATDPDGDFAHGVVSIENGFDFKTALPFAIADGNPERRFIRELTSRANAQTITAWLKNAAARFYAIEYSWKKGEHPKRGEFSPDFFILQGSVCLVVEIKGDEEIDDPSAENIKKHQFASSHFQGLNERLLEDEIDRRYHFTMLTPRSYNTFFQTLRDGTAETFVSELDVVMRARADQS